MATQTLDKPVRAGIFSSVAQADRAIRNLLDAGFSKDQISVVCSEQYHSDMFEGVPTRGPAGTRAPQAAATGSAVGATIGGLALAITTLATGGTAFLVGGPLFLGAGAVAGGLTGAMVSRGFEREITNYYDQAVQQGKILVAVDLHDASRTAELDRAEQLLADAGAEPVPLPEG